uniref:NADH-ubiquinone oxidoreductase chain 3 n=1 Tax=Asteronotus hepaticus TaxID=2676872 RepID=A0A8K1I6W9_9GAST|nr:NADH dehydrogenase subunit 3 [Asteronotus hepaticus]
MFILAVSFSIVLCVILVIVYMLTNYLSYGDFSEKLTAFECGFDPLSKMRSPFSTRFFLLVVLFLIFDVEIALLFPVLSVFSTNSSLLTMAALSMFLFILLFGMFHEWNEGALDWFSN